MYGGEEHWETVACGKNARVVRRRSPAVLYKPDCLHVDSAPPLMNETQSFVQLAQSYAVAMHILTYSTVKDIGRMACSCTASCHRSESALLPNIFSSSRIACLAHSVRLLKCAHWSPNHIAVEAVEKNCQICGTHVFRFAAGI